MVFQIQPVVLQQWPNLSSTVSDKLQPRSFYKLVLICEFLHILPVAKKILLVYL